MFRSQHNYLTVIYAADEDVLTKLGIGVSKRRPLLSKKSLNRVSQYMAGAGDRIVVKSL